MIIMRKIRPIDLTVIFLTTNRLPQRWVDYHWDVLNTARGQYPLISISRTPLPGDNLIDTDIPGYRNIYRQLLRGAKVATTEFIAVAEDDTLYPPAHFYFHRPAPDVFAYNNHRWALFTWGIPTYNIRQRLSNATLIAPRALTIAALEERFARWPGESMPYNCVGELGRVRIERNLGVTSRVSEVVYSVPGVVQFNHDLGGEPRQREHRKSMGQIQAFDIPQWGRADELVKRMGDL